MLATHLIRLIEAHATELVHAVIRDIRTDPRTASFARVSESELTGRLLDLYAHLGDWIGEQTDERIDASYTEIGRRRYTSRIPLAEAVYAMILIEQHLHRFVRDRAFSDSAVELYSEEQLHQLVWSFFDRAVYFMVKGYEDERHRIAVQATPRAD